MTTTTEHVTIAVPRDRVWCGRGCYLRLSDDTELIALRPAHPESLHVGRWVRVDDDEWEAGVYSAETPQRYEQFLWGVPAVEIARDADGVRRFRLDADGAVVREFGTAYSTDSCVAAVYRSLLDSGPLSDAERRIATALAASRVHIDIIEAALRAGRRLPRLR